MSSRSWLIVGLLACTSTTMAAAHPGPARTGADSGAPFVAEGSTDRGSLTLADWLAGMQFPADWELTIDDVATSGTVASDGTIVAGTSSTPTVVQPAGREGPTVFFGPTLQEPTPGPAGTIRVVGAATQWSGSTSNTLERWQRYLGWGWDRTPARTDLVIVGHVGDVAAYLCGAGSTGACIAVAGLLAPRSTEPPTRLEYGSARDVIVDHPGAADSRGRFLALAVSRRPPASSAELAELVLHGRSRPDPHVLARREERVVDVQEGTAELGAATALEVSLDAAWIAARRTAGLKTDFERYVAIVSAPDGSPLRSGDRVLLVDGAPVGRGMFMAATGDTASTAVFTVFRDERRILVRASDVESSGVQTLEAARTDLERPAMTVRSSTSGPSAGVVSALGYLDALTPGDLTAGATIAGTATITPHGYLGRVGGVAQKTVAAVEAGADVLFVHPDDAGEATTVAAGALEVMSVRSLREVVELLCDLDGSDCPPTIVRDRR